MCLSYVSAGAVCAWGCSGDVPERFRALTCRGRSIILALNWFAT